MKSSKDASPRITALIGLILFASLAACAQPTPMPADDSRSARSAAEAPGADSNDAPEAVARYREARRLIASGSKDRARTLLEQATTDFPESRLLHLQYAELLWDFSEGTRENLLRQAAQEAARAAEIGLRERRVDYAVTSLLAQTLGRLKDRDKLERLFGQILTIDSSSTVYLDYATGLAFLDDPKAEKAFKQALQPDPNGEAAARYGEWLLDHHREEDALKVLPKNTPVYYIHFLRGVALERLDRQDEAKAAYTEYRTFSQTFPAPERFRISGSKLQSGIRFEKRP